MFFIAKTIFPTDERLWRDGWLLAHPPAKPARNNLSAVDMSLQNVGLQCSYKLHTSERRWQSSLSSSLSLSPSQLLVSFASYYARTATAQSQTAFSLLKHDWAGVGSTLILSRVMRFRMMPLIRIWTSVLCFDKKISLGQKKTHTRAHAHPGSSTSRTDLGEPGAAAAGKLLAVRLPQQLSAQLREEPKACQDQVRKIGREEKVIVLLYLKPGICAINDRMHIDGKNVFSSSHSSQSYILRGNYNATSFVSFLLWSNYGIFYGLKKPRPCN